MSNTADSSGDVDANQSNTRGDSLVVGVSFVIGLTVFQRLVGFGRSLLFCRILEDDELGRWSLAFSFLLLAAPLAVIGLPGCFGRYVEHYRQRNQLRTFLRRTATASVVFAATALVLLLSAPATVARIVFADASATHLVYLLAASLIAVLTFNFLVELLTALREIRAVSLVHFTSSMLFAVVAVGLLLGSTWRAEAVISGYAIATGVASVIGGIFLWRAWRTFARDASVPQYSAMWGKLLPFAVWLWIANIVANLFDASDRFMLLHLTPEAWNAESLIGQYHASRIIPVLLVAVADTLAATLLPYVSQHWESGDRKTVSRQLAMALKLIGLLLTAGATVVVLASPLLFGWLLQGKYDSGLAVLPLTLVYCVWFGLFSVVEIYLFCCERTRFISLALGIGLAANIAMNFLLLPLFGLHGAVTATLIGNAIALLIVIGISQKLGLQLDRGCLVPLLLPLALLLGPVYGTAIVTTTLVATVWSPLVLSTDQRGELMAALAKVKRRFGFTEDMRHAVASQ